MPKHMTNDEFILNLMNCNPQGALMHAFVLTALEKYAQSVTAAKPEDWTTEMISFDAWQRCATETTARLNEHFKQS